MSRARDQRRRARRDLHTDRAVPALYIPATGQDPISCTVRTWFSPKVFGALPGGGRPIQFAQMEDGKDRLVFLRDEIPSPRRGAVVSIEDGEAYRIDHTSAPDDITIIAEVTALTAAEATGLPVPA